MSNIQNLILAGLVLGVSASAPAKEIGAKPTSPELNRAIASRVRCTLTYDIYYTGKLHYPQKSNTPYAVDHLAISSGAIGDLDKSTAYKLFTIKQDDILKTLKGNSHYPVGWGMQGQIVCSDGSIEILP